MTATKADIIYHRNSDFEEVLRVENVGTGSAIDLTGDEFELVLWNPADDGNPDYTFKSGNGYIDATDLANGKITLDLPPQAVAAGTYSYHLVKLDADRSILCYGTFTALEGVAQPVAMLNNHTEGMRLLFDRGVARVIDLTTPANDFYGDPNDLLTYSSPSTKYIRNRAGLLVPGTMLRCEYDKDGNALGLSIESASTNHCTQPEDLAASPWSGSGVAVSKPGIAPDGTKTLNRLTEDTTNNFHYRTFGVTGTASVLWRWSIFVSKHSTETELDISLWNSTDGNYSLVRFNPQTGVVSLSIGTHEIENWNDDFWRVSVEGTPTITQSQCRVMLGNGNLYTGDGVTYADVWGGVITQNEALISSYVTASGSAATRVKDTIYVSYSFDDTIISGVCRYTTRNNGIANAVPFSFANSASPSFSETIFSISGAPSSVRNQIVIQNGGVNQVSLSNSGSNQDGQIDTAFRLKQDDFALVIEDETPYTDTSGLMPGTTLDSLAVGSDRWAFTNQLDGHLKELSFVPVELSDAILEGLVP